MGFTWSPRAFTLARDRFTKLAEDADGYLHPMLNEPVFLWNDDVGLLSLLLIHHDTLAKELAVSTGCTSAMLRTIDENLGEVGSLYTKSDDASRENIGKVWDDLGLDLPDSGDANLEQHDQGAYDFGSDYPPHGYSDSGDYSIQDAVNFILGLPKSAVIPQGALKDPALQAVWNSTFGMWEELCSLIAILFSGDWEGVHTAGDAMCKAGEYWVNLSAISRRAAGTLFATWDGNASERAEWFVSKVCDLYADAAEVIYQCGNDYKMHAHGCYLLFTEIKGIIPGIPDELTTLFHFLDRADKDALPAGLPLPDLSAIYKLVKSISDKVAAVVGTAMKVLSVIKAIIAVVLACMPLLSNYTNQMRGALD